MQLLRSTEIGNKLDNDVRRKSLEPFSSKTLLSGKSFSKYSQQI